MNGSESPASQSEEPAAQPLSSHDLDVGGNRIDSADDQPLRLSDLSDSAADRIRRFLADATVKGGSSPADVADLYTAVEIVADDAATAYLDGRYVHGEVPTDWRNLQDDLTGVFLEAPRGISGEDLLGRLGHAESASRPRSIFDDPDDLDGDLGDASERMSDVDPRLADLTADGRRAVERHVITETLGYGIAPARTMALRESLDAVGDQRALQYLDLPFDRGERPRDWEDLRDRALRLRAAMERRGWDSAELFAEAEGAHGVLEAGELLAILEERVEQGR